MLENDKIIKITFSEECLMRQENIHLCEMKKQGVKLYVQIVENL